MKNLSAGELYKILKTNPKCNDLYYIKDSFRFFRVTEIIHWNTSHQNDDFVNYKITLTNGEIVKESFDEDKIKTSVFLKEVITIIK